MNAALRFRTERTPNPGALAVRFSQWVDALPNKPPRAYWCDREGYTTAGLGVSAAGAAPLEISDLVDVTGSTQAALWAEFDAQWDPQTRTLTARFDYDHEACVRALDQRQANRLAMACTALPSGNRKLLLDLVDSPVLDFLLALGTWLGVWLSDETIEADISLAVRQIEDDLAEMTPDEVAAALALAIRWREQIPTLAAQPDRLWSQSWHALRQAAAVIAA